MSLDYCDTCQTTTVHDKTRPEAEQCLRCARRKLSFTPVPDGFDGV